MALIAAFLAAFYDWTPFLNGSEKGTIVIVAADKKQGRAIFRFLSGMLKIPLLAGRITRETADSIDCRMASWSKSWPRISELSAATASLRP